jgi:hypothetical protein
MARIGEALFVTKIKHYCSLATKAITLEIVKVKQVDDGTK